MSINSIVPETIDDAYPVAGQDNDSQGFRDNFNVIKNNTVYTKAALQDLDDNTAKTNAENVFFENNLFLENNWPKEVLIQPKNSIIGDPLFQNLGGKNIVDYYPNNIDLIKDKGVRIKNIIKEGYSN